MEQPIWSRSHIRNETRACSKILSDKNDQFLYERRMDKRKKLEVEIFYLNLYLDWLKKLPMALCAHKYRCHGNQVQCNWAAAFWKAAAMPQVQLFWRILVQMTPKEA